MDGWVPRFVTLLAVISALAGNKLVEPSFFFFFFPQSPLSSLSGSAGFEGDEGRSRIRSKKALSICAKRILYILVSLCGIDTCNTAKLFR